MLIKATKMQITTFLCTKTINKSYRQIFWEILKQIFIEAKLPTNKIYKQTSLHLELTDWEISVYYLIIINDYLINM